jgi:uncharacterized phage-like protein YoqJ
MIVAAFTGHRPPKAGLTWNQNAPGDLKATTAVRWFLRDKEVTSAIVGGALGFDQIAAYACWLEGVPYTVAVPCQGQSARWNENARERYATMLELAETVITVTDAPYSRGVMQVRNEWMVDRCDILAAWWNGSPGGTWNCIQYARDHKVPVVYLYSR